MFYETGNLRNSLNSQKKSFMEFFYSKLNKKCSIAGKQGQITTVFQPNSYKSIPSFADKKSSPQ